MKNIGKLLIFLGLMCIYLLIAGGPGWRTLYGQKLAVTYGFGAVIALWFGAWSIGTLQPTSMRPLFIFIGVVLMIGAFVLMLGSRNVMKQLDRRANLAAGSGTMKQSALIATASTSNRLGWVCTT